MKSLLNLMKRLNKTIPLLQFGKALLCSVGAIEAIESAWKYCGGKDCSLRLGWLPFIIVTIVWFCIDGFFVSGFLKQTITLPICNGSVSLTIEFGDLFKKEGLRVIPVNSFFDSIVNGSVVSASTLHGMMLTRFFAGCTNEFDLQISQSLSQQGIKPSDNHKRLDGLGKTAEYQIGKAAIAKTPKGDSFLCVALSKTNPQTNQAFASMTNVYESVRGALKLARSHGNGASISFPLLGDGLSRTGLSPVFLLHLMIQSIIEECKVEKVTNEICIVLHSSKCGRVHLADIDKAWRVG